MIPAVRFVEIAVRCLIGVVFLVSSIGKAAGRGSFDGFAASVGGMRVLPRRVVRPVALVVVAAEYAVWGLLTVPARAATVTGLLLAMTLLAAFTLAIVLVTRQGARVPCRCFGRSAAPLGIRHAVRNCVLAVLAAGGATVAATSSPVRMEEAVVAGLAGVVLGVLTVMYDDIVELFRPLRGTAPGTVRGSQ